MIRPVLSILALVLLLVASVGRSTALAAGTLDQSYTATPDLFADIDSSISFKQTYTAGISGTLDHITVYLTNVSGATPPLNVQILNSKKTVLGTTTIAPAGLPNWNASPAGAGCAPVDVTISAPQQAGTIYGIALSSNSSLTYGWCGTGASGYAGGSVYELTAPFKKWKPAPVGVLDFSTYVGP